SQQRRGSRGLGPPGKMASPVPGEAGRRPTSCHPSPELTDLTRTEAKQPNRNHQSRGFRGLGPPGKIASPVPGEAGRRPTSMVSPATGLAPALLAAAPPLLEPLHEAEPRLLPAAP